MFFFSINFEMWDPFNTDEAFSIAKLTGYLYLLLLLPRILVFLRVDHLTSLLLPIWIFFGYLTIISIININPVSKDFFNEPIFQNIILFWLLLNHEREDPDILEKGLLSFALGSVVLAVLFKLGIGIEYEWGRVTLFGANQNTIGTFMTVSMMILVLSVFENKLNLGQIRFIFLLPVLIMLQLMIETGSRVAFVSFIFAFIAGIYMYKTNKIANKVLIVTIGFILFMAIWLYTMQSDLMRQRLIESINQGNSSREYIWSRIINLILENPVFGVGLTGYTEFAVYVFGQPTSAHNVILQVLCYTGIVGLTLYLVFLWRVAMAGYIHYKHRGPLLQVLLLIPIFGLILTHQVLATKIGWVIFSYSSTSLIFDQYEEDDLQEQVYEYKESSNI